ncbi:MAG TPA: PAS domain-containing protein, partial [Proteobacteria bacterium]|nr:PAS domain-containing protein [Pseudomonadota bacterium]
MERESRRSGEPSSPALEPGQTAGCELTLDRSALTNMLKRLGIPILVINEELTVVGEINCEQMGWSQVIGQPLLDLLSPMLVKNGQFRSSLGAVLSGEEVETDVVLVSASSEPRSYRVRMAPIASNGMFLGMISFFDTSKQAKLEEELNYLRDYSENVIKHIPSGLIVTDNDGKIILANPAAQEMLAAKEDLEGKNAEEVFGPDLGRALVQGREHFRSGRLEPGEVTIKRMDGAEIVLGFRAAQLFDAHHRVVGMILVFKDVTELKSLRTRLAQADKMAALGTLASGIAHEFNNLIGAMMGYAQLAKATGKLENYKKCVQVVFESCRRAQEIVHNLLSFARRRKSTPEEMQLE